MNLTYCAECFFSDDLSIIDVFEYIVFISNAAAPTEYRLFDYKLIKDRNFTEKFYYTYIEYLFSSKILVNNTIKDRTG